MHQYLLLCAEETIPPLNQMFIYFSMCIKSNDLSNGYSLTHPHPPKLITEIRKTKVDGSFPWNHFLFEA